nr:flagellar motor protein MotB [Homoserinimonas aerilata]
MPQRRKKKAEAAEEHPDERWMASYMDMVTVLMCMFIVLFAMSAVDQDKFEALKNSLATGFGQESSETVDTATGVVVPAELVSEEGEGFTDIEIASLELNHLEELREHIRSNLAGDGLEKSVSFTIDERGLTVRLVGSETFFETNRTELSSVATRVLNAAGPPVAGSGYGVSVEGHADGRPAVVPFPTNWELASGRATTVLRYLVEWTGVPAERVGAVGFGSARPLVAGTADSELAANRRVDIVVLSALPEAVRALIPKLQSGELTVPEPGTAADAETVSSEPASVTEQQKTEAAH